MVTPFLLTSRGRGVAYLESSALTKLLIQEPESRHLRKELQRWARRVSSELAVVEVLRLVHRTGPPLHASALHLLQSLALRPMNRGLLLSASRLDPQPLRSLDAIHLATALALGPALEVMFTYDRRLLAAAKAHGVPTAAPA